MDVIELINNISNHFGGKVPSELWINKILATITINQVCLQVHQLITNQLKKKWGRVFFFLKDYLFVTFCYYLSNVTK